MAIIKGFSGLKQVGAEPVISVAQQMAFYLSVSQDDITVDSSDEDSCTILVGGEFIDVAFNPITSMVIDWVPA